MAIFLNLNGKTVNKNLSKYLIRWDDKSPSKIQFITKQFLKQFWKNHIVYEECVLAGTKLRADILNTTLKICVEVNGIQHNKFHFFHNGQPLNYLKGIKNDDKKLDWLNLNNFKLIEINHDEVPLLSKEFFKEKFDLIL
jgi:hypothetical protein